MITSAIQGSGVAATEIREIGELDHLEVSIPVQIEVTKGDDWTLELTMDDNLLEHVNTSVENGRLRVSSDQNLATKAGAILKITSPSLKYGSLMGAVDGSIEELSGESTELHLAGSSDVTVGLQTADFSLHIAGSGTATATGACTEMDVSIAGSGTLHAGDLAVDDVSISIAGSGDAVIHAGQTLGVSIAGSGRVRYKGNPTIKKSVAGSGSIEKLE